MEITKQFRAEIAHRLPHHPGACQYIHGHSYRFCISVAGEIDPKSGMVTDFKNLKNDIKRTIGHWDHSLILCTPDDDSLIELLKDRAEINLNIVNFIPTAENMAEHIAEIMCIQYGHMVTRVRVWETTTSCADWTPSKPYCGC